ncbi:uncharacterized protein VTP21DRAFT_5514 [Calcarisporiella thermophila]|uniref:uncharacterized protein n=1 Tax=Calcarisporiella thermophila TaxID=911321 RepID=UPI003743E122
MADSLDYSGKDFGLFILALFFPYLSVFFKTGCSVDLLINVALSILGHIPGIIHAFYIIHMHRDNRVPAHAYYPVAADSTAHHAPVAQPPSYGATTATTK